MQKFIYLPIILLVLGLVGCGNSKDDKPVYIGQSKEDLYKIGFGALSGVRALNSRELVRLEKLYTVLLAAGHTVEAGLTQKQSELADTIINSFYDCGLKRTGIYCFDDEIKGLKLNSIIIIKNGVKNVVRDTMFDDRFRLIFVYTIGSKELVDFVTVYMSDTFDGSSGSDSVLELLKNRALKILTVKTLHEEFAKKIVYERALRPLNERMLAHMFKMLFIKDKIYSLNGVMDNVYLTARTTENSEIKMYFLKTISLNERIREYTDSFELIQFCKSFKNEDFNDELSNLSKIIIYQNDPRLFNRAELANIIDKSSDLPSKKRIYELLLQNTGVWSDEDFVDIVMFDLKKNQKVLGYKELLVYTFLKLSHEEMNKFYKRVFLIEDEDMVATLRKMLKDPYMEINKNISLKQEFMRLIAFAKNVINRDIRLWKVVHLLTDTTNYKEDL